MPKEKNENGFKRDRMLVAYVSQEERDFINRIVREFGYPSVSVFVREAVFAQITALQRRNSG